MQLGFVIDHSRCIGCHACTVACKSENDVPVGSFRTWVKYTESGTYPQVRRSFAVLRCNQCTEAPCVTICPVGALEKRDDGIVDVDPARCIGCKACLQGCPYDAIYLNDSTGTVEKCHFCAHRTERGLAPACAVVCPTEAIIPGDFDDPESVVSRRKRDEGLAARKTEAGTGPNVWYAEAAPAGLTPVMTSSAGGYLWAERRDDEQLAADRHRTAEDPEFARTTYNVDHPAPWGWKISAYLWTKALSAGVFVVAALAGLVGELPREAALASGGAALAFLALTSALLVADLGRPSRFLYILRYPNWSSWLTRGSFALVAYGAYLTAWLGLNVAGSPLGLNPAVLAAGVPLALLSAVYTAWLFQQAKGRVLWMERGLTLRLLVHAVAAGAAAWLLAVPMSPDLGGPGRWAQALLVLSFAVHVVLVGVELFWPGLLAPRRRHEEHATASELSAPGGPFARLSGAALLALATGVGLATAPSLLPPAVAEALGTVALGAVGAAGGALALVALALDAHRLVKAGQALPIS